MDTTQNLSFTSVAIIGIGIFVFVIIFLLVLVRQQILLRRKTKAFYERELTANEEIFARIAAEVHDDLGSTLYGIKLKFKNIIDSELYNQEKLQEVQDLLKGLQQRIRRTSQGLLPKELSLNGIAHAIDNFIIPLEMDAGIKINTAINLIKEPAVHVSLHVFRIIQELMHNSLRHSGAGCVDIKLTDSNKSLQLWFRDNGKGLTPVEADLVAAGGMATIKNRIDFLDGSFMMRSQAGEGIDIEIIIPLK